jgi:multicomponent Na+:H+ antiporter subunit C
MEVYSIFGSYDVIELFSVAMFFISFYGLITSRNIIKSIIFIIMMEVSVIMFWLSFGFRDSIVPPIMESMAGVDMEYIADPLPQALMITAIVIGLTVTAINIIMFITLYRKYQTTDWDIAKKRSME